PAGPVRRPPSSSQADASSEAGRQEGRRHHSANDGERLPVLMLVSGLERLGQRPPLQETCLPNSHRQLCPHPTPANRALLHQAILRLCWLSRTTVTATV